MVKHLRFSKVQLVGRTGALMLVSFLDDQGNAYDWAPRWDDVEEVFLKQINVERFNKPDSAFLNKFARTAEKVVEGAQRIKSVRKVVGRLEGVENEQLKLCMEEHNDFGEVVSQYEMLKPGFEVTIQFCDDWLLTTVEALVVNEIAIRLKQLGDLGGLTKIVYPPQEEELPF